MENIKTHEFFNLLHDFCDFASSDERKKLEEFYGSYLSLEAWVLLSLKDIHIGTESNEYSAIRIMNIDEIISAGEELEVDFLAERIIPLVDCREGSYLVYNFSTQIYSQYHATEQQSFMDYENLNDFVQKRYKDVMRIED